MSESGLVACPTMLTVPTMIQTAQIYSNLIRLYFCSLGEGKQTKVRRFWTIKYLPKLMFFVSVHNTNLPVDEGGEVLTLLVMNGLTVHQVLEYRYGKRRDLYAVSLLGIREESMCIALVERIV